MGLGRHVVVVHAENKDLGLDERCGGIGCERHIEIFC